MTSLLYHDRLVVIKHASPDSLRVSNSPHGPSAVALPEIGILETVEALRHRETYRQAWHIHRQALEIHCVFSGAISYEFGDRHAPVTISGGECLVIPRGVRHCAVAAEGTPSMRLVVRLRTSDRIEPTLAPFTPAEVRGFFAAFTARPFEVWTLPPHALRAARDLHRAFEDGEEPPFQRLAVWTFLAETARASAEVRPEARLAGDSPHAVVDRISAYLREHLAEHLRLRDLTHRAGYSERHLLTLFRARTGLTPGRYLARCRIDRAQELLAADPSRPLVDIALACGFSSHAHFTEVFRRYVGETPSAWAHHQRSMVSNIRLDRRTHRRRDGDRHNRQPPSAPS